MKFQSLALLVALLMVCGCSLPPEKKHTASSSKFNEWQSYETKNFEPKTATVASVDVKSGTIALAGKTETLKVTPQTRIIHDGTDITLAQLPVNVPIKYTISSDGGRLLSVWYGHGLHEQHRPSGQHKEQNTFF